MTYPSPTAASLSVEFFLCAVFAISAALSYPIFGESAVTVMSESARYDAILSSFAVSPSMQWIRNIVLASRKSVVECKKL